MYNIMTNMRVFLYLLILHRLNSTQQNKVGGFLKLFASVHFISYKTYFD